MKEYDQSVTCLADDLQTLEIRSNMLRTTGIQRRQTIAYISNHSNETTRKPRKDPNQT